MAEHEDLRRHLADLHHSLTQTGPLDEETKQLLQTLAADVQRLLDQSPANPPRDQAHSLTARLREALLDFETSHPHLTAVLGRIADSLAGMGI